MIYQGLSKTNQDVQVEAIALMREAIKKDVLVSRGKFDILARKGKGSSHVNVSVKVKALDDAVTEVKSKQQEGLRVELPAPAVQ